MSIVELSLIFAGILGIARRDLAVLHKSSARHNVFIQVRKRI